MVALLSSMFLLISAVFQYYAQEARPYSIVLACITFALLCYQRSHSPIWVVLMALSLADRGDLLLRKKDLPAVRQPKGAIHAQKGPTRQSVTKLD